LHRREPGGMWRDGELSRRSVSLYTGPGDGPAPVGGGGHVESKGRLWRWDAGGGRLQALIPGDFVNGQRAGRLPRRSLYRRLANSTGDENRHEHYHAPREPPYALARLLLRLHEDPTPSLRAPSSRWGGGEREERRALETEYRLTGFKLKFSPRCLGQPHDGDVDDGRSITNLLPSNRHDDD
jgi:hypothetical protein